MDAIDVAAFPKWAFTKESVGELRSRCDEEASVVDFEGEVVFLDVEEEEDQEVDVEGDETPPATRSPEKNRSQEVDNVEHDIALVKVPNVTESKEAEKTHSPEHAVVRGEHFSPVAERIEHVGVDAGRVRRSSRSKSYCGAGFASATPSSSSNVRKVSKSATDKRRELPKCKIVYDKCDGGLRPEDSVDALLARRSEVTSTPQNTLNGSEPPSSTLVYLWKCAVGVCRICGKIFNNNSNLKRHAHVHGSGILLTCDVCGKFFSDRSSLWRHKKQHFTKTQSDHPKVYKCNICGKCVNSSNSLKKHSSQHVQPYVCHVCGESFHRASGLKIHKYLHVRSR